jgi:hypothetical protein
LAADRNGETGKAYNFDGEDDYIDVSNLKLNENGKYALSLWFKPSEVNHAFMQYLIDLRETSSQGKAATIAFNRNSDSKIGYLVYGPNGTTYTDLTLNKLAHNHVVVIHDSTKDNVKVFINGELGYAGEIRDFISTNAPLRIGGRRQYADDVRNSSGIIGVLPPSPNSQRSICRYKISNFPGVA